MKITLYIGIGAAVVLLGGLSWFIFRGSPATSVDTTPSTQFGSSDVRATTGVNTSNGSINGAEPVVAALSTDKVFKVTDGPIAGATLLVATRPTSTVARFVLQTNGHVFDLALDSPGAIPKAVSNTTIPGISRVLWSEKGRGALLQYLDNDIVKTAHLSLPPVGSTTPPARIQFLPSGISDLAVAPDGAAIAYLTRNNTGSDGYVAAPDGSSSKKLFSLPLAQLLVTWPAIGTLLVQTPAGAGVSGMLFSVNTQNGATTPLVYAQGLTAVADRSFGRIMYQTVGNDGVRTTYSHNVRTGLASPLSFAPLPERCVWSQVASTTVYCPTSLVYTPSSYVDLWHQGVASVADAVLAFNLASTRSQVLASPGGSDGGVESSMLELISSPIDNYLLFIRKDDRSLWGVRL